MTMNHYISSLKDLVMGDAPAPQTAPPSVLHELNAANRRLEKLLADLRSERNAESELRAIAREVIRAVQINPDIALACIFLNQINGTYAVRHCLETAIVAIIVAGGMGKTDGEMLTITAAALTMNVGMLRYQNTFHSASSLTSEEMSMVRRHPLESVDLLRDAGVSDEDWIACVLQHHENDDGSGYPVGCSGIEIQQNARLISMADRYCAQVSARNYRCSVLPDRAMANILDDQGKFGDQGLCAQFAARLGKFPPGTLVRLASEEIGVVTQHDDQGDVQVQCLRDAGGKPLRDASGIIQVLRRSSEPDCAIKEALTEDQAEVRFSMKQIWGEQASL